MEVQKTAFEQAKELRDYNVALTIIEGIYTELQRRNINHSEELLIDYAEALGGTGELEQAKAIYQLVEDTYGKSIQTHSGLYRVAYKSNDFEKALELAPYLLKNTENGYSRNALHKNIVFLKALGGFDVKHYNSREKKIIDYTKRFSEDKAIHDIIITYTNQVGMSRKGRGFALFSDEYAENMESVYNAVALEISKMPKDLSTDSYNPNYPTFDTYYVEMPNCGVNANGEQCDKVKIQTLPHSKQPFDICPSK